MSELMSERQALIRHNHKPTPAGDLLSRILDIARGYGCPDGPAEVFIGWLIGMFSLADETRQARAAESKLEPLDIYGASRVDTLPPGKFAQGLRQKQAQSASMAMVLMADDLKRAYARIGELEAELAERKALP